MRIRRKDRETSEKRQKARSSAGPYDQELSSAPETVATSPTLLDEPDRDRPPLPHPPAAETHDPAIPNPAVLGSAPEEPR